jgi:hypothetical protein
MPSVLVVLLCGVLGAVATHIAYVQSNLFILNDTVRRGRRRGLTSLRGPPCARPS